MAPGVRTLADTVDVDEARERVGAAYCPHGLTILGGGRAFRATQREATVGDLAIHSLRYGADVRVDPVPLGSWVLASTVVCGGLTVSSGRVQRQLTPGQTVVLDAYRGFSLSWMQRCTLRTIRLPRTLVETVYAESVGAGHAMPARFELGGAVSGPAARTWRGISDLLAGEAAGQGIATQAPLVAANLQRAVAAAIVSSFPIAESTMDTSPGGTLPRSVRKAIELAEHAPERPLSTLDLAQAAGLGARALQEAFRRHVGSTPMGYLRDVRLRRAHDDLRAADPSEVTVAEIAHRWGFGHVGRFARQYAERYQCPPSRTLCC